jgi:Uma2 family endonuclease
METTTRIYPGDTQTIDIQRVAMPIEPLPLLAGDRLSRAEFERRYQAHPEIKKAELIDGIVYMPSPVKYKRHGKPHYTLVTWTGVYAAATPGVEGGDNATLRLDNENEPQPDILVRLDRTLGGRSFVDNDDYVEGSPELVIEIAASTANYDMHAKKRAYARNGVQEYIVALMYERVFYWFAPVNGEYVALQPDTEGIIRSQVFPGLWLQPAAFWNNDLAAMLSVLEQGLAAPAHKAFMQKLSTL